MKTFILKSFTIFPVLLLTLASSAQLIRTDPVFPLDDNNSILITFDATQGDGGLAGYTGDVYAYTGLITSESDTVTDWQCIKAAWGQNTPETKMTRIGPDLYTLEITSNIREYYDASHWDQELIYSMVFIFRSAEQVGGSWLEGKNIMGYQINVQVWDDVVPWVLFTDPLRSAFVVSPGDSIPVEVHALNTYEIKLFVNDTLYAQTNQTSLVDTLIASNTVINNVDAWAYSNDIIFDSISVSFTYIVRPPVTLETLPAGVSNGINYPDDNTAVLCLTAPGKEFAFVLGEFNNWEYSNDYYMKQTPDGEKLWLEIEGLVPMQEYVFQYEIDGELLVADPYTEKTSDPWHDKLISEQVYSGLIEYPEEKTTGIASILQTGQPPFEWEVESFTPVPVEKLLVYKILIRDFTTEHTYQSILDTLGYLEKLGITALELMPVNEFEGNSSWGYNPSFYFSPDKYYGPKNELKALIDECHKRGIAVIIDMVLNHSYNQSPFVRMYLDGSKPAEDNPWYNMDHNFTNPDAQWGHDFDHESLYTQQLVDSIAGFWMNEYKVDGFRFDFTKGFGNNIKGDDDPWGNNYDADRIALLKRMADEIWERNPDAYVILDHHSDNSEEKELAEYGMLMSGNLSHTYAEATMAYNTGTNSDFSWISYKERGWNNPHLIGYMESHDEERTMFKNLSWGAGAGNYDTRDTNTALERMGLAASFFYTIPGPKMIWQFGEMGYDYSIDYNGLLGEKPVRWDYYSDYRRKYLYDVVSSLIQLKKEYNTFSTEDFELYLSGDYKQIVLNHPDMNACIIGNFNVVEGEIVPKFQHTGKWYDFFSGDSISIDNLSQSILLNPGEYRIYTDIKLENPNIGTGIGNPVNDNSGIFSKVYSNPSNGRFNIELNLKEASEVYFTVFDMTGKKVYSTSKGIIGTGLHHFDINLNRSSGFMPGLYFLQIQTQERSKTSKLIIQ